MYISNLYSIGIPLGLVLASLPLLSAWARRRPTLGVRLRYGWGSVYVLQDLAHPHLVKVGMTRRRCATRKAEVSLTMTGGGPLRQAYAVHLPYVEAAETIAHRRLARFRHRSDRGTEWYRLCRPEDLGRIIEAVERSAHDMRRIARRQRRWSAEADETATAWRLGANGATRKRLFN